MKPWIIVAVLLSSATAQLKGISDRTHVASNLALPLTLVNWRNIATTLIGRIGMRRKTGQRMLCAFGPNGFAPLSVQP